MAGLGLTKWISGFDIKARKARLVDHGISKATGCTQPFIAEAVVTMLKQTPSATENKTLQIAEVDYSGAELLSLFEKETGTKWDVENVTVDGLLDIAERAKAENNPRLRTVSTTLALNYGGSGAAYFPQALSSPIIRPRYLRRSLAQIVKTAIQETGSA